MITPKQARFVAEWLKDHNGKQAAIRAGYSPKTAEVQASALLRNLKVKAEVDRRMGKLMGNLDISAERVLKERARLAFFDVRKLLDEDGKPIPLNELDDDTAAAIAGVDVYRERSKHEEGSEVTEIAETVKYKMADKNASLTALEKHLGLYKEDGGDKVPLHIHLHL